MAFYNDLGKKIQQTGQNAIDKTKRTAEIARMNTTISSLERDIDEAYSELGKAYFLKHANDNQDSDMSLYVKTISEKMNQIQEYRDQIVKLKGFKRCINCEMEIDEDATFCHYCGAKQTEGEETSDNVRRCPNCGQILDEDSLYCPNCGQRIEEGDFCANCGARLEEDAVFCSNCGQKVER